MSLKSSFLIVLSFFVISCTTKPVEVEYTTPDNYNLKADLYLPKENKPVLLPLVIVIHGGGWSSRSGDMENICLKLRNKGFAVINVTYRFAPDKHHPVQINDVRAVMPWLQANAEKYHLDKNQISVWGYSAGAHLAFLLANQKNSALKINAVVVGGIPSYFPAYPNSPLITDLMGMKFYDDPKAWGEASPVNFASAESPPTFIYHGEDDSLVGYDQAELLAAKLAHLKVKHQLQKVKNRGHLSTYFFGGEAEDMGIDFIKAISP